MSSTSESTGRGTPAPVQHGDLREGLSRRSLADEALDRFAIQVAEYGRCNPNSRCRRLAAAAQPRAAGIGYSKQYSILSDGVLASSCCRSAPVTVTRAVTVGPEGTGPSCRRVQVAPIARVAQAPAPCVVIPSARRVPCRPRELPTTPAGAAWLRRAARRAGRLVQSESVPVQAETGLSRSSSKIRDSVAPPSAAAGPWRGSRLASSRRRAQLSSLQWLHRAQLFSLWSFGGIRQCSMLNEKRPTNEIHRNSFPKGVAHFERHGNSTKANPFAVCQ
jgi:hypothetical protein